MKPIKFENFGRNPDVTVLKNQKKSMITSRLVGAAYSRPEENHIVFSCIKLLEFIRSVLSSSIEVTGG